MGKRKNRANRQTYLTHFVGKQRAPRGRKWTKPSVIVGALESVAMTNGVGVQCLYDYAVKVRNEQKNRGNVFLEYAWSHYCKAGRGHRIMSEADILADTNSGAVNRWYDTLCKGIRGKTEGGKVMFATNPQRLKASIAEANASADVPKVDKAKEKGDAYRAERMAAQIKRAEYVTRFKAEQKLLKALERAVS